MIKSIYSRSHSLMHNYPRQFWLMFWGMLISTIGSSMIWPFLMIYVSEHLNTPLTTTASLMTINATTGLIASFIVGPIVDRFGRKWMMAFSLVSNGVIYLFLSNANTFPQFGILMALSGAANPLYRVGADAMIADLVPPEKRVDAYSLLRLSNNAGVALGPTIGGLLASTSYTLAFYGAAIGMVSYSLLIAFFAVETLPKLQPGVDLIHVPREKLGGYKSILQDTKFISLVVSFSMAITCAALVWILMPVYAKENYQVPEKLYGLIPTTNAIMVVTLQLLVTRITKRYRPLPVLAVGTLFYTIAVCGVALAGGFLGFWICMVVMTIGELILVPTSSTYVANLAPTDKRGRYMSIYGLTWSVASGLGPIFGGVLNDTLGPRAIWYGGTIVGFLGVAAFLAMAKRWSPDRQLPNISEEVTNL